MVERPPPNQRPPCLVKSVPATQWHLVYNVANNPKGQVKENALLYCIKVGEVSYCLKKALIVTGVLCPVTQGVKHKTKAWSTVRCKKDDISTLDYELFMKAH